MLPSLLCGEPTPKLFTRGTQRALQPAQTLAKIAPWLAHCGITRVANVTGMDTLGVPTVMVTRPNARSLSVSQGKGIDLDNARVSGVMEAIEQWHAEHVERPLRLARRSELGEDSTLAGIERLPSGVQRYDRDQRILWIAGQELRSGLCRWVPFEAVHLDLSLPMPEGSGYFLISSNGLASGNCMIEAVAHGLCELVERDAVSLFYALGADRQWQRRLDPSSVDDDACRALLARFELAGVEVAIWDVSSEIDVPVYLCSALDRIRDPFRPTGLARGSGCHPDPAIALARALTEAAQSRVTRIVGTRDDISARDFEALQSEPRYEAQKRQMATPTRPPRAFGTTFPAHATFEQDVQLICERLAERGMPETVAVDLSREQLPVSVVRVIVPGLEGPSEAPGYTPGARALAQVNAS